MFGADDADWAIYRKIVSAILLADDYMSEFRGPSPPAQLGGCPPFCHFEKGLRQPSQPNARHHFPFEPPTGPHVR